MRRPKVDLTGQRFRSVRHPDQLVRVESMEKLPGDGSDEDIFFCSCKYLEPDEYAGDSMWASIGHLLDAQYWRREGGGGVVPGR